MPYNTLASDNFDRANNADLGALWTPLVSTFKIVSNRAEPNSVASDAAEFYNGVVWPDDQWVEANLFSTGGSSDSDSGPGFLLRATNANNYYRIAHSIAGASSSLAVSKVVASAYTNLDIFTISFTTGDLFLAEIVDNVIRCYKNGVQQGIDITDNSLASGNAGIFYSSTVTTASIDNWEGGDFAAAVVPDIDRRRIAKSRRTSW